MYHTVSMIFYNTERCQECQKMTMKKKKYLRSQSACLYYVTLFSILKNSEVLIYQINCYINQIWSPLVIGFFSYILVYFRAQSWYFNKFTLAALLMFTVQLRAGHRCVWLCATHAPADITELCTCWLFIEWFTN